MEWLEMLEILERALEAANNLPTAAERTRAIAAAYEAAASNLGNTTAREVLQQISSSSSGGGRAGDLARLILRRVPEQAARTAIASGAGAGAGAGAGGRALTFLGLSWGAWMLLVGGGLLVIGGSYIYFRPDQPVQPGPAMTRPRVPSGDLERMAGTWFGTFKRNDTGGEGGVTTVFTAENGALGGWHYQQSWVMENVSVSGNVVKFSHIYDECRAHHVFTVIDYETRKAQSQYTVICPKSGGHTGTITYGR